MPIGNNLEVIWKPFLINRFFYKKNKIARNSYYQTNYHKYTKTEIQKVFALYKDLKKENSEHVIDVADMLFWAYVCGNQDAEKAFTQIEKKFGPFDGAVAEEWDVTLAAYKNYKRLTKNNNF